MFVVISLLSYGNVTYSEERKDYVKAFLLSFALPGLGQYYGNSPGNAKLFIASELALWGCYYYTLSIKGDYRDDYLSYAALHAGVNPSGHGTSYLNAVGGFKSSFDYNNYQLQTSDNPVVYSGNLVWNWDAEENRSRFKYLRERELDYENYAKYCVAGIILNHFLSGLHAAKLIQRSSEPNGAVMVNTLRDGLTAHYSWSF